MNDNVITIPQLLPRNGYVEIIDDNGNHAAAWVKILPRVRRRPNNSKDVCAMWDRIKGRGEVLPSMRREGGVIVWRNREKWLKLNI